MTKSILFAALVVSSLNTMAQSTGFTIVPQPGKKQVDILYNNKLLTAYCYYDSSRKPVLFPVNTVNGVTVTRGYPFIKVPGERTDHPHHTGIWLNYESVNGLDFWNNSTAIPVERRNHYGTIVHQAVTGTSAKGNSATLNATATWIRPDKKVLLNEQSVYHFSVQQNDFIIDRTTTLTATDIVVEFKDVKDGMFAIRVARELEMPSTQSSEFVDDKGNITKVPAATAGLTGMYTASNGLKGDSVWSSQGNWCMLAGKKDGKEITIAMFDHPGNVGYPAYWHARGYGLFAVNPLGRKVFSNGKEELNLTLQPGQSVTFRYRVVVHTGKPFTKSDMDKIAAQFAKTK